MRRCCSVCDNRLIKETSEDLGSFVSVDWWWLCVTCGDTRDQDLYEECHRSGRESNPMPDRAVAERGPWYGWHTCGNCGKLQTVRCQDCGEPLPEHGEPDRAVVAISEDRRWLVVLDSTTTNSPWAIYKRSSPWDDDSPEGYYIEAFRSDTGQSAEDVLREWMDSRS